MCEIHVVRKFNGRCHHADPENLREDEGKTTTASLGRKKCAPQWMRSALASPLSLGLGLSPESPGPQRADCSEDECNRSGLRCRRYIAKQSIHLIVVSSGEIDRGGIVVCPTRSEVQGPQEWIDDWHSILSIEGAKKGIGNGVIYISRRCRTVRSIDRPQTGRTGWAPA